MAESIYPLRLVIPAYSDSLTDLIIELDHQRRFQLSGTTPPHIFFQLKRLFHLLESLGSARIEGNRTTVAEIMERERFPIEAETRFREILNIEAALSFLEKTYTEAPNAFKIDHRLIRELHKLVVEGLPINQEGDKAPGEYRSGTVRIAGAKHIPPDPADVFPLMDELVAFLDKNDAAKYDLIKVALAHHRFAWIHPFSNGNGRTVRLFTYALLLKAGFKVGGALPGSRILNPTAVFCADRDKYYERLARADEGGEKNLLEWCSYVLAGLKVELEKVKNLLDFPWLTARVLRPAIDELYKKNGLSNHERAILLVTLEKGIIKNADARPVLPGLGQVQTSRILSDMRDRRLLIPAPDSERKYLLNIDSSPLMSPVMRQLDALGFLPLKGEI
jgi:Fic family protein